MRASCGTQGQTSGFTLERETRWALLRLRQLGWATIGQTEDTCAIYGMPRAAKAAGAVERELPLADIGPFLTMLCKPRSPFEATRP